MKWADLGLLALLGLLGAAAAVGGLSSALFSKIKGVYTAKNCFLKTYKPATLKPFGLTWACATACLTTQDCRFFCQREGKLECDFFEAYVAVRWAGDAIPDAQTAYDACYTSWGDPKDLLQANLTFNYSSILVEGNDKHALDGYACKDTKTRYFVTHILAEQWTQIDLETPTKVAKLIVATTYIDHIETMDVILSNTTDFQLGHTIALDVGEPPAWTTWTIETNHSVSGRFLTFFMKKISFLGFTDLQLIPRP